MKNKITNCLALGLTAATISGAFGAGSLVDGGFETTLTSNGSGVGKWEPFTLGVPTATLETANPNSGAQHLRLSLENVNNAFVGLFQDVTIGPLEEITFAGLHAATGNTSTAIEIRIEWFDGVGGALGSTPNQTPSPGAAYESFSLVATAPAGATTARAVYAIQSFGGNAGTAVLDIDDVTVTGDAIPEPSGGALMLLGFAGLAARRRR